MSADQNKAIARRWFDDVCNGRNRASANEIVESYNLWDTLGMLQQLGVVPQLAAQ